MVSITPQCFMCEWFRKVTQEQVEAEGTDELCLAYPHGIPGDVFIGNVVHDKVLPGQEGEWVFTLMRSGRGEADAERRLKDMWRDETPRE